MCRCVCNAPAAHIYYHTQRQVLLAYVPAAQHPGGWFKAVVLQGALVREVAALAWYFVRGWLC